MAPIRLNASMLSRWISLSGVSRTSEHQSPPLLQRHIGGSGDQGVGVSVTHRRQRLHAARNDDHPVVTERAATDGRAQVVSSVHGEGQVSHLPQAEARLLQNGRLGPAAHDQMALHTEVTQRAQEPDAVQHTRGTRDADHDPHSAPVRNPPGTASEVPTVPLWPRADYRGRKFPGIAVTEPGGIAVSMTTAEQFDGNGRATGWVRTGRTAPRTGGR